MGPCLNTAPLPPAGTSSPLGLVMVPRHGALEVLLPLLLPSPQMPLSALCCHLPQLSYLLQSHSPEVEENLKPLPQPLQEHLEALTGARQRAGDDGAGRYHSSPLTPLHFPSPETGMGVQSNGPYRSSTMRGQSKIRTSTGTCGEGASGQRKHPARGRWAMHSAFAEGQGSGW